MNFSGGGEAARLMRVAGTETGKSISVQLYKDLLTGIQVGDYPALSPLPTEASLAQDYGVSRSVVRSALSVLKKDGIIVSRQGSGTIVARKADTVQARNSIDFDIQELRDCYECREAIEPEIAACAAISRSKEHQRYLVKQLKLIQDELRVGIIHTGNDADFHIHLAEMTGNRFYKSIMNSLRPHILIGMNFAKTLSADDRLKHQRESLGEHRAIANGVLNGDAEAARQAMSRHLAQGQRRIFAEL